jgi:uncharacterized protein YjiK
MTGVVQYKLANDLREVSGLTIAANGNLYAVSDERAIVYEIDPASDTFINELKFGEPAATGDFEGIARVNNGLYLTTSDGDLYVAELQPNRTRLAFEKIATGIGAFCEIEGLTSAPHSRALLFLCKTPRDETTQKKLSLFKWSIDAREIVDQFSIPLAKLGLKKNGLHPSGVAFNPQGELVIVAAREKMFVVLSPTAELKRFGRFPYPDLHNQTEGIAINTDGVMYLADEGGKKRGRLSRYEHSF